MKKTKFTRNARVGVSVLLLIASSISNAFADVQVLQIQDTKLQGNSSRILPDVSNGLAVSVADKFCVVNTRGRAVRLTFSTSNAGSGGNPSVRNAVTGAVIAYRQSVSLADGSIEKLLSVDVAGAVFDVPASAVVTSAAACPSGGNVAKWVTFSLPLPSSGQWVDQVSIKATSL